jgi:aspartate/tyrosine/aromatic aminotransferase
VKVIVYYTEQDEARVKGILNDLNLASEESIVLIDARSDNKPSGSKA